MGRTYVADHSPRHAMSLPHVRHGDCEIISRSPENVWTDDNRERVRGHLVEFLVIGDLVQVLEQPLQEVEIRSGEFTEEVPDARQTGLKTFDFFKTA